MARSTSTNGEIDQAVVVYDEVDVDDERESKVPEDWPHFSRVRGKNVVMVGGEVRIAPSMGRVRGGWTVGLQLRF